MTTYPPKCLLNLIKQTIWLVYDSTQQQELSCTVSGDKNCYSVLVKLFRINQKDEHLRDDQL